MTAFRSGFLFTGRYGYLAEYSEGRFCPPVDALAPSMDPTWLLTMGARGFLLVGPPAMAPLSPRPNHLFAYASLVEDQD